MADYFPVLSRAVAGLENNTGEARRAVYDRARAAIVRQLRAIEPPLPEEDISRERMQLEEAIRRIEANAGGAPATPAPQAAAPQPPRPAAPPPVQQRPAAPVAPRGPQPAAPQPEARGRAPEPEARREGGPTDEERAARREAKQAARGGPAQARPATRADGRPIIRAGAAQQAEKGGGRSGLVIALGALVLIGLGVGAFALRGTIGEMLGGSKQVATTTEPAAPKPEEQPAPTSPTSDADKSADRLPQDGAGGQQPAAPSEQVARAPDAVAPQPEAPAAPAPTETPPAASQPGPIVAQRAVLYEEGPNQQSGEAVTGNVVWRTESVSGGSSQPLETALRGDIDIPGRKLRATLTIRRNADATLPASHTIEIQFSLPEDFANAGISNVPGVLMKADESARGAAVSGLSVRVTNGFFLIGLSNLETERTVNEQLLRDRGWIDVPILYDNGRRAVLTLEKGTPGMQAFNEAFAAWRSASAGGAAQPANP